MDNENKYISPSCKVIEVKTQTVLCQSGDGSTTGYGPGDTSGWFND